MAHTMPLEWPHVDRRDQAHLGVERRAVLKPTGRPEPSRAFPDRFQAIATTKEVVCKESALMTDEAKFYTKVGRRFARHEVVYQHLGEKHLHRLKKGK
jgi:hypothetical protein